MSTGTLAPAFIQQFSDTNGDPLASGTVDFYAAGTTTRLDTFSDVTLTTPNANPVVLNAAGKPSSGASIVAIYFTPGLSYKAVLKNSSGSVVETRDNIPAIPPSTIDVDVSITAGENLAATDAFYISDGSGSKTAGRAYKADTGNAYSSSTAGMMGFVTAAITSGSSGSGRIIGRMTGFGGLTVGAVYYAGASGAITSTVPSLARFVGVADSISSLILAPNPVVALAPTIQTTTSTGTQNNFAQTATRRLVLYANNATALTITGLTAGSDGDAVTLISLGAGSLTISAQNASSTAANRIITPTGGDMLVSTALLGYDTTTARWRVQSFTPIAVVSYPVTIADVTNTTTTSAFATFTVPSMADGDYLVVTYPALRKNNSGGAVNATYSVAYGGVTGTDAAVSWANSATEFGDILQWMLVRVGSDLWVYTAGGNDTSPLALPGMSGTARGNQKFILTAPTFTSSQTVTIRLTFASANALTYQKKAGTAAQVEHHRVN
jgi:hypothetical protein